MAKKPSDANEASVEFVMRRAKLKPATILVITGRVADRAGALAIGKAAQRLQLPIIVHGKSKYHTGKIFGRIRP